MVTLEQYLSVAYLWFKDNSVSLTLDPSVQGENDDPYIDNGGHHSEYNGSQWHNYENQSEVQV